MFNHQIAYTWQHQQQWRRQQQQRRHLPRCSVGASDDTWRIEMKCRFHGPTATRALLVSCKLGSTPHAPTHFYLFTAIHMIMLHVETDRGLGPIIQNIHNKCTKTPHFHIPQQILGRGDPYTLRPLRRSDVSPSFKSRRRD